PPVAVAGEVLVRENLAGVGAVMALMDRRARARVRALARSITVVELAHEPDFQARFVRATQFPPLDASGWPVTATP
ncbi:MAG: ASKHA domain-containing protein, partial [Desulfobacteraceae bacterium]|nr:ASKHA domain-containing protein [Desulfobacteraceae bacterium]